MLKLGTLRWKGKCQRHPNFHPDEGEGAIKGGCQRCYTLWQIYQQHQRLIRLMREFGPVRERRGPIVIEWPQLELFTEPQEMSITQ